MDATIGYILQVITISITLALGMINLFQTKKIQKGQNIIAVTTTYRLQRSEQIKEYGKIILADSAPEIAKKSQAKAEEMLCRVYEASAQYSMILHRSFRQDMELIVLSDVIAKTLNEYIECLYEKKDKKKAEFSAEKLYKIREAFSIKCDVYTAAEWYRIKKETDGSNTTAMFWKEYYEKISLPYAERLQELLKDYQDVQIDL